MEEVEGSGLPRLLVFPGSLSSWRALIVAEELQVEVQVEVVNLFLWHHLLPGHLALSPRGSLPVLLLPTGRALEGQELLEGLQQLSSSTAPGIQFKAGTEWQEKLAQASISALTHTSSLHASTRTTTLRFPYHDPDYCTMATNYILTRADRLLEAAERQGSAEARAGLVRLAEEHQASLASHLEPAGYDRAVESLHALLAELEEELGREGRIGAWLGGGVAPSVADITLGLVLHRVWQLGLEGEFFEEGVRPSLSVYYRGIRTRPAFLRVTRWREETGVRVVKSEADKVADSAKLGIGAAAVVGGLFLVKKLLGK